jgi:hypothetical protein
MGWGREEKGRNPKGILEFTFDKHLVSWLGDDDTYLARHV